MPSAAGRLGGKALTGELRKLAEEGHTVTNDGTPRSRAEILAEMIWRQALGWEETYKDDDGNLQTKKHPPVAWCQQFLWERLEGKAQVASEDQPGGIRAADKVRDLAKQRLNALAGANIKAPAPPKFRPPETKK